MDLPKTFEEWVHCITIKCQINLSRDFVERRLVVYSATENMETKKFIELYGLEHTKQTIEWFKEASRRFSEQAPI